MQLRHALASLGLAAFAATSFFACHSTPTAADYDQTCKTDADCVGVISGTCDGLCNCPSDAINKSDANKYLGDLERSGCHASACTCPASGAECKSGVCTLVVGGTSSTTSSSTGTGG
jgi:hypothetical protein